MQLTTHIGGGHYTSPEIEQRRAKKEAEWNADQQRLAAEVAARPKATPIKGRHVFTAQELQDIREGTPEARAKWPAMFAQNLGR